MRRGQAWSVDLVIGVLIFLLVVGIFYVLITSRSKQDTSDLEVASETIATKLVDDPEDSIIVGGVVDKDKVTTLINEAYDDLKEQYGVDAEFCFFFEDENGNLINVTDEINNMTYAGIGSGSGELNLSGTPCGEGSLIP